jgi:alanyl-tRNA synthetase
MEQEPQLNSHNKQEHPPMHTAEHLLNGTMVKMIGCKRSRNAHIERKKSKCDYPLAQPLTQEQLQEIENTINGIIEQDLPVTYEFIPAQEASSIYDLERLPEDASEMLRIVHIGDYDACPCVGAHVERTSQIGRFRISSSRYQDGVQRIVFRLDQ